MQGLQTPEDLNLTANLRAQWSFWDRVQAVREQELATLWKAFVLQALNSFTLNAIPVLVPVATFAMYLLLGHTLTASAAFTSLSLFTARPCQPQHLPGGLLQTQSSIALPADIRARPGGGLKPLFLPSNDVASCLR